MITLQIIITILIFEALYNFCEQYWPSNYVLVA